jgi:hypothetical protein
VSSEFASLAEIRQTLNAKDLEPTFCCCQLIIGRAESSGNKPPNPVTIRNDSRNLGEVDCPISHYFRFGLGVAFNDAGMDA